jgi:Histidine kinase-, DNA gyrase B-, and HSP90-like ATPase
MSGAPAITEVTPEVDAADVLVEPAGQNSSFTKLKRQPGSEIFTKFADVKSTRISWTPERRRRLQRMWERGDKVPAIAAALGCKVGAISVARARFGLEPRRAVLGRPRHEPDEPAHKIERVAITTSRLMEFCTEKELVAQTGHEAHQWPRVVVKELIDNGIDACEEAEVAPAIKVTITTGKAGKPTRIVIADNGPGIRTETITGIIDYDIRVSSREAYISPTRGRQGNALKTILPMAYVLGDQDKGETWIEARGVKHRILFTVNQIKQEPIVKDIQSRSPVTTGTCVTVFWPDTWKAKIDADEIGELLRQFFWVNPHVTLKFIVDGKTLRHWKATDPQWTKYRACDATSAHWYSPEQIERYAGALIDRDLEFRKRHPRSTREKTTVRDFIAQFRGMSATEKQKLILSDLGAAHMSLHEFFGSESQVNHQRMQKLLHLLQKHTRPVRSELLGVIGEEHLRHLSVGLGGEEQSFKYFLSAERDANRLPYVVEIATCAFTQWVKGKERAPGRLLITGVNFSATLGNPFQTFRGMEGLDGILTELRAGEYAPVIVCVHYACPHIEYLDRGKSRIGLE